MTNVVWNLAPNKLTRSSNLLTRLYLPEWKEIFSKLESYGERLLFQGGYSFKESNCQNCFAFLLKGLLLKKRIYSSEMKILSF